MKKKIFITTVIFLWIGSMVFGLANKAAWFFQEGLQMPGDILAIMWGAAQ